MKRCPQLEALSAEHHTALVLARRASRSAVGRGKLSVPQAWQQIEAEFAAELEPHFSIEEKFMVPPLEKFSDSDGSGVTQALARLRDEHRLLRELVRDTQKHDAENLARFGATLHDHVRFEERTLFDLAEAKLSTAELDRIAQACPKQNRVGLKV